MRFSVKRAAGTSLAALTVAAGSLALTPAEAKAWGVWDRVAQCESGGRWNINTGNGYYGGLQFSASTWRAYGGGKYATHAHKASKAQQIEIAQKTLKGQGPGAWPVCSRKAGLTRANGGAPAPAPVSAPKTTTPTRTPVSGKVVTVKRGETLYRIAVNNKVKGGYKTLAAKNGIRAPYNIRVGQTLQLP